METFEKIGNYKKRQKQNQGQTRHFKRKKVSFECVFFNVKNGEGNIQGHYCISWIIIYLKRQRFKVERSANMFQL